jgi:very-short-patch-repair endonuclease
MPARLPLPQQFSEDPFAYRDARAAGVSHKRLRGADVSHPFHGTRDPQPDESIRRLCATYASQMDERAFFSSVTAAQLMSIPLPQRLDESNAIHVAIISPHRGLEGVRVIGHKIQPMGHDSWTNDGLVLSTPARAWCELGVLLSVAELVAAGDFIIHWKAPLASHLDLWDALERYPDKRGKRKLHAALALLNDRAESPMESQLRTILTLGGIAGLVVNHPIRIGTFSYRLDLAIPAKRVAIEYQGDYHRSQAQWRRDMTRRSRIESIGWTFVEVNGDDIRDPTELVARTRALLR